MRMIILLAATSGFLAVAAGAFGAHALRERLSQRQLEIFETGARYQLPHAVAALAVAGFGGRGRAARLAAWALIGGSLIFALSLYLLALTDIRWLGMVTPIGGVGMLTGWSLVGVAGFQAHTAGREARQSVRAPTR